MHTYLKKNERRRTIKLQILMIMAAFLVAISIFIVGGNHNKTNEVQASASVQEEIVYKSVRVNAGDTLWTIADNNMGSLYEDKEAYIDEVKSINHITEKDIQAGSYIIVPTSVAIME